MSIRGIRVTKGERLREMPISTGHRNVNKGNPSHEGRTPAGNAHKHVLYFIEGSRLPSAGWGWPAVQGVCSRAGRREGSIHVAHDVHRTLWSVSSEGTNGGARRLSGGGGPASIYSKLFICAGILWAIGFPVAPAFCFRVRRMYW
jgi:hypothetical protein